MGAAAVLTVSSASVEPVRVQVAGDRAGVVIDPTVSPVQMALVAIGATPGAGDLEDAVWDTDATTDPPTYEAVVTIGPGQPINPAAGTYVVWVKLASIGGAAPLLEAGRIVIT